MRHCYLIVQIKNGQLVAAALASDDPQNITRKLDGSLLATGYRTSGNTYSFAKRQMLDVLADLETYQLQELKGLTVNTR